jgi:alkylation response protein AidB-like acyl-CoA dehydrogenase
MDFTLEPDQQDLVAAVRTLLERRAGPERARAVAEEEGFDAALMEALVDGGFADPGQFGAGPLEAVLVTELVAAAAGRVPFATRALVAPQLLADPLPSVVVVLDGKPDEPVRFAQQAGVFLAARGAAVVRIAASEIAIAPVESSLGFPQAIVSDAGSAGTPIPEADASTLARWRQVALAAEIVGCMDAALRLTVAYVSERRAFGHPLGALQAVQHRLAELQVAVDGARWLTREAAYNGAPADAAATACAAATAAVERVVRDTHQLTGAMSLTREYDLHLWTLPMWALSQEAGGLEAHREAVAMARWSPERFHGHLRPAAVPRHPIEDAGGPVTTIA